MIYPKQIEDFLGIPVYLVGGSVRDFLLDKAPKDYDFSTPCSPDEVELAIKNCGRRAYILGKKFGTIGFKFPTETGNEMIEITTFRSEAYQSESRKPEVAFTKNFEADMSRRDFTINAMSIKPDGKIWDSFGGREDLVNKTIKAVGHPKTRFKDDPLRILRAIRFATILNFHIEEKTFEYICKMKFHLLEISKERWVMELDKILGSDNVVVGLDLLMDSGVLGIIIPELTLQKNYQQNTPYHDFTLWEHTKRVVNNVPASQLDLRWTALLHDIAKPFTRTENKNGNSNYINHDILGAEMASKLCNHLKFSKTRTEYIVENIRHHLEHGSDLKIYDDGGKKITSPQID